MVEVLAILMGITNNSKFPTVEKGNNMFYPVFGGRGEGHNNFPTA